MMDWFKQKLLGPLVMFLITSLAAGMWMLVVISLENKNALATHLQAFTAAIEKSIASDARHDIVDAVNAKSIKLLTNQQIQLRLDTANNSKDIEMLRRDIEAFKKRL